MPVAGGAINYRETELCKSCHSRIHAERGCERLVNTNLIEQYAMSVSRWVQCETCISEYGFLAKHPTTGAAITSPYVGMSQNYLKQVNQCWYQIYQIVKENCSMEYGGANPHDDLMEHLLAARRK